MPSMAMGNSSDTTPTLNPVSDFPFTITPFPFSTLRAYGALGNLDVRPATETEEEALE